MLARHTIRIAGIWLVLCVLVELFITTAPIPSPTGSPEAVGERQTLYVLFYVGAPLFVLVWVLCLYAIFARRSGEEEGPPAPSGSISMLPLWTGIGFIIVIFLAGWGTFTLHEITAAPRPSVAVAHSSRHGKTKIGATARPLIIQVIGRQWQWIFRYPSFGGMETRYLVVPYNVPIQFHVTALDVVHSLWIYDYDIKQDAVPGLDSTVWFLARKYGDFTPGGTNWVKCNELCGNGHSHMVTGIYVKSQANFAQWARAQERLERSIHLLKLMPKYSATYYLAPTSPWPSPPKEQAPELNPQRGD